ncbi:MAG: hypothetical protein HFH79_00175 [Lachnospiraceae bacterium]|nr:hypothetical protein [Lachnospiraceae bacterium]
MRANRKWTVRAVTLVLMALVAAGIVLWDFGNPYDKQKFVEAQETTPPTEASAGEAFELSVWNGSLCIEWWKNEQDNAYYLFLPGAFNNKKLNLTFSGAEEILLDDKKVSYGDRCRLKEGSHVLRGGVGADSDAYQLEVMYTSDIASVFLETQSGSLEQLHAAKENSESGTMTILDGRGRRYFEGEIENIHCRGNSSFEETDKKSYLLKLSQKADLFGMGAAKKWILTANSFDDTLLRNAVAFSIAKMLRLDYTPDVQFVDVYANGRFLGNYLLSEKIEIGKNRINVLDLEKETEALNDGLNPEELEFFMEPMGRLFSTKGYLVEKEPEDLTGGYLMEIETSDRYGLEASGFLTSRMQAVVFESPKYASHAQVAYVSGLYQDFEDAVFSPDGFSPYTGAHYSDYIDVDSFARKYLVEELVKNLDASYTSQFFYKYPDSVSDKFYAGPCWDYDKSIAASGITNDGIDLHDPVGFYAAVQEKDSDLWYALYQQEDFRRIVADIFFHELEPQMRREAERLIEGYSKEIDASNDCNMLRWNTFPQTEGLAAKRTMHEGKVAELVTFLDKRLDFLGQEWEELRDE